VAVDNSWRPDTPKMAGLSKRVSPDLACFPAGTGGAEITGPQECLVRQKMSTKP
jgi:hypothetical protein